MWSYERQQRRWKLEKKLVGLVFEGRDNLKSKLVKVIHGDLSQVNCIKLESYLTSISYRQPIAFSHIIRYSEVFFGDQSSMVICLERT